MLKCGWQGGIRGSSGEERPRIALRRQEEEHLQQPSHARRTLELEERILIGRLGELLTVEQLAERTGVSAA